MDRCCLCDKPDWRDSDCKIYGQGGGIQELLIDDEGNWWDDRCSMWINSHGQRITGYIAESARHVKNVTQYFDNHPYCQRCHANLPEIASRRRRGQERAMRQRDSERGQMELFGAIEGD